MMLPFLTVALLVCNYQIIVTVVGSSMIDHDYFWIFALYGMGHGLLSALLVKIRHVFAAFSGTAMFLIAVAIFFRSSEAPQIYVASATLAFISNLVLFYKLQQLQLLKNQKPPR